MKGKIESLTPEEYMNIPKKCLMKDVMEYFKNRGYSSHIQKIVNVYGAWYYCLIFTHTFSEIYFTNDGKTII